jgi:transposase
MDTNNELQQLPQRAKYRHHSVEFKRAIVIESLKPGASVSRIARQHDINANQIFAWRKTYREGGYGEPDGVTLLAVTVGEPAPQTPKADVSSPLAGVGRIELTRDGTTLRIDGQPDPDALRVILAHWLR